MQNEYRAQVLARLSGVRRTGEGWSARCPAHADTRPSLTIRETGEGRLLLNCHAGCPVEAIVAAAGLELRHLAPPRRLDPTRVTAYSYYDAAGRLVAVKERIAAPDGKRFVLYTADGYRARRGGLEGRPVSTLPLYGLPALLAADPATPVWLVEGEKACEAARAAGLLAVSLAGGAGQRDFGTALAPLAGRPVRLWPDADAPGRAFMARVAAALRARTPDLALVAPPDLPDHGDAADFFAAGRPVAELVQHLRPCGAASAGQADADPPIPPVDPLDPLEPAGGAAIGPGALPGPVAAPAAATPLGRFLQAPGAPAFRRVLLDTVAPVAVEWLWRGRIPLGKITILDGDPGLGKSLVTCDLAARVSRGDELPDGTLGDLGGPAGVVVLNAEDGLADTIQPRLVAAGADLTRISVVTEVEDARGPRLPTVTDLAVLAGAILQVQARLVIVDPLMAYLGPEVNAYVDQDIRRVLAPLKELAEASGVAFLLVRHLSKNGGGSAVYRGGGSIGLIGAARAGLLVGRDPDDPQGPRRILAPTKGNLAAPAPAYAFHVTVDGGTVPTVAWEGPVRVSADELLGPAAGAEDAGSLGEAIAFLRDLLAGGPRPQTDVQAAADRAGVSEGALKRAKARAGVVAVKERGVRYGQWLWRLPDLPDPEADAPLGGPGAVAAAVLPADPPIPAPGPAPYCWLCLGPCRGPTDPAHAVEVSDRSWLLGPRG